MQTGPLITTFKALSSIEASWLLWPDAAAVLANAYLVIAASLVLAVFLIGLGLTIKYSTYLLNDFKTISNSNIPDIAIKLWFALVLLLPLFLDAGPVWFTVWWAVIFCNYLNRAEKRLVVVILICVALSGLFAKTGGNLVTYASTHSDREIFLVEHGLEISDDITNLVNHVNNYTRDTEAANALAVALIRKGENDQAISLIDRCLSIDSENPVFYNTKGIALAAQQKQKEAADSFQHAVKLGPKEVIYYFNLSRAYLEVFNIVDADIIVDKMTELDPREANRLLSRNTYPMYAFKETPLMAMLARQMKDSGQAEKASDELWHAGFGIFNKDRAFFAGLGALIVFFLMGIIPRDKFTQKCSRCGNSFYVGALTMRGYPICLQCNLIETRTKKQHSIIVQHKLQEIKNYSTLSRRRSAKLEMMLPGLGSIAVNRTLRSVVLFWIMSLGIIMAVSGGVVIHSFMPSVLDFRLYIRISGVVLLLITYLTVFKYPPVKKGI